MVVAKNLQALIYFAKYRWRRELPLQQVHWDADALARIKVLMQQTTARKADKTADNINPGPIEVGLGYRDWVGRFRNKLKSTIGAADVPLIYIIRVPHDDEDDWIPPAEEADAYAMRLDGPEFDQDNKAVFSLLYNCCNHEKATGRQEALAWIDPFSATQNGRSAFAAFRSHFEGTGAMNVRKTTALATIKRLTWETEMETPFAEFSSELKKAYDVISEDAPYSDVFKVRELLAKMKPKAHQGEMNPVKETITREFSDDFVGAIDYAMSRIADIFSEEITRKNQVGAGGRRRYVAEHNSERNAGGQGRGGRGNFQRGGTGRGGGRGAQAGRRGHGRYGNAQWNNARAVFGGIDATDPTRDFSPAEWDRLGPIGRAHVNRERKRINDYGRGGGRGRGRMNYGVAGRGRSINEVIIPADGGTNVADSVTMASRGGRSGAGFGRGAHQRGGGTQQG
jgi:hypothetical protein